MDFDRAGAGWSTVCACIGESSLHEARNIEPDAITMAKIDKKERFIGFSVNIVQTTTFYAVFCCISVILDTKLRQWGTLGLKAMLQKQVMALHKRELCGFRGKSFP
jgi:hypothetical protein